MTGELYTTMMQDLLRPHPHAEERVGFVFGKYSATEGREPVVYLYRYTPVVDEQYIPTEDFGALIDDRAILAAMQEVRTHRGSHHSAFHVHLHANHGEPTFSKPDRSSLPAMIPSFQQMDATAGHGLFLLSKDHAIAWVWHPGETTPTQTRVVSVIGSPVQVFVSGGTENG